MMHLVSSRILTDTGLMRLDLSTIVEMTRAALFLGIRSVFNRNDSLKRNSKTRFWMKIRYVVTTCLFCATSSLETK